MVMDFAFLQVNIGGFVCVEVLRSSQHIRVKKSALSLPNHTFPGQAYIVL